MAVAMVSKRIENARVRFYESQEQLAFRRGEIWRLTKVDYAELEKQLIEEMVRYPLPEQINMLLGEIADAAKVMNISLNSIAPRELVTDTEGAGRYEARFNRVPIDMRVQGCYEELARFIFQLKRLQHGVLRVDQFEMSQAGSGGALLNMALSAKWYVKKHADEPVLDSTLVAESMKVGESRRSRFDAYGRNPFQKAVKSDRGIYVQGIIFDPPSLLALVNGELRRIGDRVGNMSIVEIKSESVIFSQDGKRIEIPLKERSHD